MTKVQTRFALAHPLSEREVAALAQAHGVYGIFRVRPDDSGGQQVIVDYDASRLSARDVEASLIAVGVPVVPRVV